MTSAPNTHAPLPLTARAISALYRYREAQDDRARAQVARWANLAPPEVTMLDRLCANLNAAGPPEQWAVGLEPAPNLAATLLAGLTATRAQLPALTRAFGVTTLGEQYALEHALKPHLAEGPVTHPTQDLERRFLQTLADNRVDLAAPIGRPERQVLATQMGESLHTINTLIHRHRPPRAARRSPAPDTNGDTRTMHPTPTHPTPPLTDRFLALAEERGLDLTQPLFDRAEIAHELGVTPLQLTNATLTLRRKAEALHDLARYQPPGPTAPADEGDVGVKGCGGEGVSGAPAPGASHAPPTRQRVTPSPLHPLTPSSPPHSAPPPESPIHATAEGPTPRTGGVLEALRPGRNPQSARRKPQSPRPAERQDQIARALEQRGHDPADEIPDTVSRAIAQELRITVSATRSALGRLRRRLGIHRPPNTKGVSHPQGPLVPRLDALCQEQNIPLSRRLPHGEAARLAQQLGTTPACISERITALRRQRGITLNDSGDEGDVGVKGCGGEGVRGAAAPGASHAPPTRQRVTPSPLHPFTPSPLQPPPSPLHPLTPSPPPLHQAAHALLWRDLEHALTRHETAHADSLRQLYTALIGPPPAE